LSAGAQTRSWTRAFTQENFVDTRHFFRDLATLESFDLAAGEVLRHRLPDDWFVVIADVMGSTQAIESGRYKDVNTVGAATIMAVINVDRSIEIPFSFGGDGATLAIPPCMEEGTRKALLGAKEMAREAFGLELRVGLIAASEAKKRDLWLGLARYRHSPKVTQAAFGGQGWAWAEKQLKSPDGTSSLEILATETLRPEADFTGFECRWRPIPARQGFKLAVIIQSISARVEDHAAIYHAVLKEVRQIYGEGNDARAVHEEQLALTFNPRRLWGEASVYASGQGTWAVLKRVVYLLGMVSLGSFLFRFNITTGKTRWGGYKREVAENADFQKFDGALKMVLDSSRDQTEALRASLERRRAEGRLIYGLHQSTHAIMTCLVFTAGQNHAHFVDGSDGGYAMAAKELKAQLAALPKR
jgi:hypothetical protein